MFEMLKWKYKIVPVNPEKNIYTLTPTWGTWLKVTLPSLVPVGLIALGWLLTWKEDEISVTDILEEETDKEV